MPSDNDKSTTPSSITESNLAVTILAQPGRQVEASPIEERINDIEFLKYNPQIVDLWNNLQNALKNIDSIDEIQLLTKFFPLYTALFCSGKNADEIGRIYRLLGENFGKAELNFAQSIKLRKIYNIINHINAHLSDTSLREALSEQLNQNLTSLDFCLYSNILGYGLLENVVTFNDQSDSKNNNDDSTDRFYNFLIDPAAKKLSQKRLAEILTALSVEYQPYAVQNLIRKITLINDRLTQISGHELNEEQQQLKNRVAEYIKNITAEEIIKALKDKGRAFYDLVIAVEHAEGEIFRLPIVDKGLEQSSLHHQKTDKWISLQNLEPVQRNIDLQALITAGLFQKEAKKAKPKSFYQRNKYAIWGLGALFVVAAVATALIGGIALIGVAKIASVIGIAAAITAVAIAKPAALVAANIAIGSGIMFIFSAGIALLNGLGNMASRKLTVSRNAETEKKASAHAVSHSDAKVLKALDEASPVVLVSAGSQEVTPVETKSEARHSAAITPALMFLNNITSMLKQPQTDEKSEIYSQLQAIINNCQLSDGQRYKQVLSFMAKNATLFAKRYVAVLRGELANPTDSIKTDLREQLDKALETAQPEATVNLTQLME